MHHHSRCLIYVSSLINKLDELGSQTLILPCLGDAKKGGRSFGLWAGHTGKSSNCQSVEDGAPPPHMVYME